MSEAPKEIVAGVDYENFNGTRLRMGCVTVGTDGVPMPFDPTHYIRRDIHRALLKAERDRIEALDRQVKAADALAEKLEGWIGVAATCAIESGVCRCGDNMERHGNPLDCGHSPVDHGAYAATQLIDDTTSALAAYRATKEGGV